MVCAGQDQIRTIHEPWAWRQKTKTNARILGPSTWQIKQKSSKYVLIRYAHCSCQGYFKFKEIARLAIDNLCGMPRSTPTRISTRQSRRHSPISAEAGSSSESVHRKVLEPLRCPDGTPLPGILADSQELEQVRGSEGHEREYSTCCDQHYQRAPQNSSAKSLLEKSSNDEITTYGWAFRLHRNWALLYNG